MPNLFDPLQVGALSLNNRMLMAPLTRGRADEGGIPNQMMAEYYGQRAAAGLIISEATAISTQGYGWVGAPGIWNSQQAEAWKLVTNSVHSKGGRIFLQLWHMGRVSHPDFQGGDLPVAPSAIAAKGQTTTPLGKKDYVRPREMTVEEIRLLPQIYAEAATRSIDAGFDGVEIHAANGYLLDQFIRYGSNSRVDEYGGPIENRIRLLGEVASAVGLRVGAHRVGVRLSPRVSNNSMHDSRPIETFTRAAEMLNDAGVVYLHIIEALPGHRMAGEGERVTPHIRKVFKRSIIANGGYHLESANEALLKGEVDAISFGLPFLANPDLVRRFQNNFPLNSPNMQTLYMRGPVGYTDYPLFNEPHADS